MGNGKSIVCSLRLEIHVFNLFQVYLDAWRFVRAGDRSIAHRVVNVNNAINAFSENWTNDEFVEFVDNLRHIVDAMDITRGSESWAKACAAWDRVIELEIDFWPKGGEETTMINVMV